MPSATVGPLHDHVPVSVRGEDEAHAVLHAALDGHARVIAVTPRRETLEDLFLRKAIGATARER